MTEEPTPDATIRRPGASAVATGVRFDAPPLTEAVELGPVIAQKWEDRACRIANRDLTEEEWQHYMGDLPYQATCSER